MLDALTREAGERFSQVYALVEFFEMHIHFVCWISLFAGKFFALLQQFQQPRPVLPQYVCCSQPTELVLLWYGLFQGLAYQPAPIAVALHLFHLFTSGTRLPGILISGWDHY